MPSFAALFGGDLRCAAREQMDLHFFMFGIATRIVSQQTSRKVTRRDFDAGPDDCIADPGRLKRRDWPRYRHSSPSGPSPRRPGARTEDLMARAAVVSQAGLEGLR